ncbi:MAG: hypothetical protein DWQ01_19995 [Planctomycetota bacterium]|nr:MAG: hypothetical protein DWQ01_19995 [Planctomycetota bacterium]
MSQKQKQSLKDQAKRSPGKALVLVLIVLGAGWAWKGVLFGKSKGKKPAQAAASETPAQASRSSQSHAAPAAEQTAARKSTTTSLGSIQSFESAMERIRIWRRPLKLHDDAKHEEVDVYIPEPLEEEPLVEEEQVELVLKGVAILGRKRYAQFESGRYEEGQKIGRYIIQRISRNQVELLDGREVRTLRVTDPSFGKQKAQGKP